MKDIIISSAAIAVAIAFAILVLITYRGDKRSEAFQDAVLLHATQAGMQ